MAVPTALPDPRRLSLAMRVQALFRVRGKSLADPDTAETFQVSMEAAQMILNGALATGVLTGEAHEVLTDFFEAAAGSPELV